MISPKYVFCVALETISQSLPHLKEMLTLICNPRPDSLTSYSRSLWDLFGAIAPRPHCFTTALLKVKTYWPYYLLTTAQLMPFFALRSRFLDMINQACPQRYVRLLVSREFQTPLCNAPVALAQRKSGQRAVYL